MSRFSIAVVLSLSCLLWIASSLRAADALPEKLTMNDLANHPERWPAEVTVKKTMQFGGGNSLREGQQVRLTELQGADVVVDAGKGNMVAIGPDECDLLDAANKAWATLTPQQRAVDVTALEKDASLWPDKVKCMGSFDVDNGKTVPAGQELTLSFVDHNGVVVYCENPEAHLTARIVETDLISRAREQALIEPAKRKSRIIEAIRGQMMDSTGKPYENAGLDDAKVIVLYQGASWCQPCHKFSPTLVKFVNENSAGNPHLFVAMLSADDKDPDLLQYATEAKMPWPLIPKAYVEKTPSLKGLLGNYIPQLLVLDHYGKVIASSNMSGRYDNTAPMRILAKVVKAGDAK